MGENRLKNSHVQSKMPTKAISPMSDVSAPACVLTASEMRGMPLERMVQFGQTDMALSVAMVRAVVNVPEASAIRPTDDANDSTAVEVPSLFNRVVNPS